MRNDGLHNRISAALADVQQAMTEIMNFHEQARVTIALDELDREIVSLIDEIEDLERQVEDKDILIASLEEQLLELKSILP